MRGLSPVLPVRGLAGPAFFWDEARGLPLPPLPINVIASPAKQSRNQSTPSILHCSHKYCWLNLPVYASFDAVSSAQDGSPGALSVVNIPAFFWDEAVDCPCLPINVIASAAKQSRYQSILSILHCSHKYCWLNLPVFVSFAQDACPQIFLPGGVHCDSRRRSNIPGSSKDSHHPLSMSF